MKIFRKTKVTIKIKLFRERRLLSFETPIMEFLETYLEENGHKFFLKKSDRHYLVIGNFKISEDFGIKDIILHEEKV